VVNLDTPFGQQLLVIAVGQVDEPQVSPDRDRDHLRSGTGTPRTPTAAAAPGGGRVDSFTAQACPTPGHDRLSDLAIHERNSAMSDLDVK